MNEYFVVACSNPAPFVGDESKEYITASDPQNALVKFCMKYKHPCGLYSAYIYTSADAFFKDAPPLARFKDD